MQGKGIVKFFLVVLVLVSILQYFFMLPTSKVEKKADEHAKRIASTYPEDQQYMVEKQQRIAYLDSMSGEEIFKIPGIKSYTYADLKSQQLNWGLDLKGGLSTVLQVDLRDYIRKLANNTNDASFNDALNKAYEAQKNTQSDFVTLFGQEYAKIDNPDKKSLQKIFKSSATLREDINLESTDNDVLKLLRTQSDQIVQLTYERLKLRIDKMGVLQPNISLDAARDLINIELPGVENPERAREYIGSTANLEFWEVYQVTDGNVLDGFFKADQFLKNEQEGTEQVEDVEPEYRIDTTWLYQNDTLGNVIDSTMSIDSSLMANDPFADRGPLLKMLDLNNASSGQLLYFYQ